MFKIPIVIYSSQTTRLFVLLEQFYKNNEAQSCPKIKNKLRTIEARLVISRFNAGLSAVGNTERAEKKWKPKCIYGNNKPMLLK